MRRIEQPASPQRNGDRALTQADHVAISQDARNKYRESLQLRLVSDGDRLGEAFRQFYETFDRSESANAIAERQREQWEKEQALRLSVEYVFPGNTLEDTVKKALEGKVANASLYAAELGRALRSAVSMPDRCAEERAAYREMALKQAEYQTEYLFDNAQEEAAFMNAIQTYYWTA